MEIIYLQAIIGIAALLFLISIYGIQTYKEMKSPKQKLNIPYDELMGILVERIKEEFRYKYLLDYRIKDVRVIYDLAGDTKDMSKKILASLTPDFYANIELYHTKEYIIRIVTREVEILMLDYTDKFKIDSK